MSPPSPGHALTDTRGRCAAGQMCPSGEGSGREGPASAPSEVRRACVHSAVRTVQGSAVRQGHSRCGCRAAGQAEGGWVVPGAYFSAGGGAQGALSPWGECLSRQGIGQKKGERQGRGLGLGDGGVGFLREGAGPAQSQRPAERVPGP